MLLVGPHADCFAFTADEEGNVLRTSVGMVGYPNVGKSSTINVLCGRKRVTVSATPGKTKRFQTLLIGEQLQLVDCPGLVFPSVVSSRADMLLNGLLAIDQLRDNTAPIDLLCARIPRRLLERTYGLTLPPPAEHEPADRPPRAHELLQAFAFSRGFVTARGTPDESRAARLLLKDYVNGRLLFAMPPPGQQLASNLELHEESKAAHEASLLQQEHVQQRPLRPEQHPHQLPTPEPPSATTAAARPSSQTERSFRNQAQVVAVQAGKHHKHGFTRVQHPFTPVEHSKQQQPVRPSPATTTVAIVTIRPQADATPQPSPLPPAAAVSNSPSLFGRGPGLRVVEEPPLFVKPE